MIRYLCLLLVVCCVSCCEKSKHGGYNYPKVRTFSGNVAGRYREVHNNQISEFLGIPFAVAPLNERRFMKPEPIELWDGLLWAHTKHRPCMQFTAKNGTIFSSFGASISAPHEDCLYLNIWAPRKCTMEPVKYYNFPVLVWIHGGGFSSGSSHLPLYDGATIASKGQVIVVSFNYRLGSFGFLYGGIDEAPGNAGMYDQVLALEWVNHNIRNFGGDENSVTLFGEGAGAISISLHMIAPLSRRLFNRAILQSGSYYDVPIIDDHRAAQLKTKTFAALVNCSYPDLEDVVNCLKSKDAFELSKAESLITDHFRMMFTPIYNDRFLPKSPVEMYDSGRVAPVEVIAGVNRNEASIFLNYVMPHVFPFNSEPQLNISVARGVVKRLFSTLPGRIKKALWQFYFRNISKDDSPAIVRAIQESYGDFAFNCPTLFLLEKLNEFKRASYLYWMTHRSLKSTRSQWVGVSHFDDIPYVFGMPIKDTEEYTPEDKSFSVELIKMWVTFAHKGRPMDEDLWPEFNSSNPIAFELNFQGFKELPFPRKQPCEFWRTMLLSLPSS